jgi:hypothetical protein
MSHYGLVLEQSRKSKTARNIYDYLRHKSKPPEWIEKIQVGETEVIEGTEGIQVSSTDKFRVLNMRLLDEHLSPYFRTDMNLFHMLMMDDTTEMTVFKSVLGWLFVFEGIPIGPKPFGQNGFDMR